MDRRAARRGHLTYAGQLLALAILYFVLGQIGLAIAPIHRFAVFVWPPTGVALAALVLGGYRLWPAIAFGAFATNFWSGAPPWAALGIAVGNTVEAVLGTFALQCIPGFRGSLERSRDVVGLAVLAGMMSTVISATIGVASLSLSGVIAAGDYFKMWKVWWTADFASDLQSLPDA